VRSTVTLRTAVVVRPSPSAATARSARLPSAGSGQAAEYGGVVSVASVDQTPVAQSGLSSEHRANETETTPLPGSLDVAETLMGSAEEPFTYPPSPGAVSVKPGGESPALRAVTFGAGSPTSDAERCSAPGSLAEEAGSEWFPPPP
jgi:hypothetical protein